MSSAALYDLSQARPTYNFCVWLARATQERYDRVAIKPGPVEGFQRRNFPPTEPHERRFMLENVMLPAIPRFGLERAETGRLLTDYSFRGVAEAYRNGKDFRRATASRKARDLVALWVPAPYVTVTLRQTPKFPARNSNMATWGPFIQQLRARMDVRVVPDTEHAHTEDGWAAVNLDLRMALYEGAVMNFGVTNGPTSLMVLMDAPYCLFKQVVNEVSITTEAGWKRSAGMNVGDQFPWAHERQRLMWRDDTRGALEAAAKIFL